ncbi:hypothetical protein TH1_09970 [Thalassospira lucentensis MCCC 1A00383 = DSM 14000]|nr:hypothetical protein TH1_09970 [Thalassospira lucentensis MCCC 1A00383 = DSM 14000]
MGLIPAGVLFHTDGKSTKKNHFFGGFHMKRPLLAIVRRTLHAIIFQSRSAEIIKFHRRSPYPTETIFFQSCLNLKLIKGPMHQTYKDKQARLVPEQTCCQEAAEDERFFRYRI